MGTRILRLLSPFIIPAILIAMGLGLAVSLARSDDDAQARDLRMQLDQQLEREDALRRDNRRLRALVDALWSSNRLDEKVAREEANLIRPGEVVFEFPLNK